MAASKSKMNDGRPQPHVDIAQMKANGHDPADVIALAGYVGVAPSDDVVRLHPGLDDMSLSVDIDARDIVATTDAPVSTMPMGGVVVWVIRTAEVKFRKTRTVSARAQQMRFYFGAGRALEPDADSDRAQHPTELGVGAVEGSAGVRAARGVQSLPVDELPLELQHLHLADVGRREAGRSVHRDRPR